jgi:multiple antibiotic resistance protein|tara:strand:- start:12855 stop:13493 length:639 start_codon:yes stop_codon:yes gene_type:complete
MDFLILSIISLITLINPVGIIPTYLNIIENFNDKEQREITFKACIVAFILLLIFAIMGTFIFNFFNLTIYAFKIVGGILFFRIGLNMVESKVSRTKSTPQEEKEALNKEDITYTPLGIPLIAGPGAITSVMILSEGVVSTPEKILFVLAIAICIIITYIILSASKKMSRMIGTTGIRVIQRVMGIILMAIAVQLIFNGLHLAFEDWIYQSLI